MTEGKVDKGAWWIENGELHLDLARLLENFGLLPPTDENIGKAIRLALELAANELENSQSIVVGQGGRE